MIFNAAGAPSGNAGFTTTGTSVTSQFLDEGGATFNVKAYGAKCDGTTDDTAALVSAASAAAGKTLLVPCLLHLASPGAGSAVVTLATQTTLLCIGEQAGFDLAKGNVCVGGSTPGAPCSVAGDCAGSSPTCPAATAFAPTGASKYTVVSSAASSIDVTVRGCTFLINGQGPYNTCNAGTRAGKPCSTNDTDASTGCPSGTGPDYCTGASGTPSGAGQINPIDLSATLRATVVDNAIWDHRQGDFDIAVDEGATVVGNRTNLRTAYAGKFTKSGFFYVSPEAALVATGILQTRNLGSGVLDQVVSALGVLIEGNTLTASGIGIQTRGGYINSNAPVIISNNTIDSVNSVSLTTLTGIELGGWHNVVSDNTINQANICVRGQAIASASSTIVAADNTVDSNHCMSGNAAGVITTSVGWDVSNNYISSGNGGGGGASVQIGETAAGRAVGIGHGRIHNNIVTNGIAISDMGFRCQSGAGTAKSTDGSTCTAATDCVCSVAGDCPGSTCSGGHCVAGTVCAATSAIDQMIENNLMYGGNIDILGTGAGGNTTAKRIAVVGNMPTDGNGSSVINFPTTTGLVSKMKVLANDLDTVNWLYDYGTWDGTAAGATDSESNNVVHLLAQTTTINRYDAVQVDTAHNDSFIRAVAGAKGPVGVLLTQPALSNTLQKVMLQGKATVNVDSVTINVGDRLKISATNAGQFTVASPGDNAFAKALTARGSGTTVRALISSYPPDSGSIDQWTYLRVNGGNDFTTTSASFSDITGLAFTPAASTNYEVFCHLQLSTSLAASNPELGILWPTDSGSGAGKEGSADIYEAQDTTGTGKFAAATFASATAQPQIPAGSFASNGQKLPAYINASFTTSPSVSGSWKVQLASETATNTSTVYALGSFCKYRTFTYSN